MFRVTTPIAGFPEQDFGFIDLESARIARLHTRRCVENTSTSAIRSHTRHTK
jgi:hypothetical protein